MPTVLRIGAYRFFFYSQEGSEPSHIHVERDNCAAKFWLRPVKLARSTGFSPKELGNLLALAREHEILFLEAWNGHFSTRSR